MDNLTYFGKDPINNRGRLPLELTQVRENPDFQVKIAFFQVQYNLDDNIIAKS